jgi:hypothetical protein
MISFVTIQQYISARGYQMGGLKVNLIGSSQVEATVAIEYTAVKEQKI